MGYDVTFARSKVQSTGLHRWLSLSQGDGCAWTRKKTTPKDAACRLQSNLGREAAKSSEDHPVEVVDEDTNRYKVHYVGYSQAYDEWKPKELVQLASEQAEGGSDEEELVSEKSSVTSASLCTKNFHHELRHH